MTSSSLRSPQIAALALVIGTFFTAQTILMSLAGRGVISVEWDLLQELLYWVVWAALAPVIRAALQHWPIQTRVIGRAAVAQAIVALVLAAVQTVIAFGLHLVVLWFAGSIPTAALGMWMVRRGPSLVWGTFMGTFFYALIVGLDAAMRVQRLYVAERLTAADLTSRTATLEAALAGAQLEALRSQLRPHFLFNTLNAISVLTVEDPSKAQQMLLKLSTLLRRSLDETEREVSLRQELVFLNEYLDIQRVRFGSRLEVGVTIDAAAADARVPPFLLQPLVENAIEHAAALREQPTIIALRARRAGEALHISVEDNGPGPLDSAPLREGVGLRNTREQLQQLYGQAGTVSLRGIGAPPYAGACAEVTIPYSVTPACAS